MFTTSWWRQTIVLNQSLHHNLSYTQVYGLAGEYLNLGICGTLFDIRCAFLRKVSIYIQKKFTIYQPAPEPPTGLRLPVKDGYVLPGHINFISQNGQSGLLNINAHIVHFVSSFSAYTYKYNTQKPITNSILAPFQNDGHLRQTCSNSSVDLVRCTSCWIALNPHVQTSFKLTRTFLFEVSILLIIFFHVIMLSCTWIRVIVADGLWNHTAM